MASRFRKRNSRSSPAPVTSGPDVGPDDRPPDFRLADRLRGIAPSRLLLGLDFDGTLAPIVAEPEQASPDRETIELIRELRGCLLRIVIISGRDTDQLGARIPIDGVTLVGNHGLEEREGDRSRLVAEAEPFVVSIERAADAVARLAEAHAPGVTIERKRVTLSVHFRNAADPQATGSALEAALRRIADREHLQLRAGRLVLELRPPLEIDKGEVLRRLAGSLRPAAIVYAGDDLTDADAFRALASMRPGIATLAIGVRSNEVPDAAFADCDVVVDGVDGIKQLLDELLTFCRDNPVPTSD